MQKEHRDAIQRNFSSLVEQTDLELMVAALYEKRVFSDAMIEPYRDPSKDARTRKRQLYLDIMRRGPRAFPCLLDALSENGYWDVVRALDPHSALHTPHTRPIPNEAGESSFLSLSDKRKTIAGNEKMDADRGQGQGRGARRSPPWHPQTQPPAPARPAEINGNVEAPPAPAPAPAPPAGDWPVPRFNVVKAKRFFEDDDSQGVRLYRTRGRPRGVLLLFSYMTFGGTDTPREGARTDHDNLRYLFTELDFRVLSYVDLTLKDTRETLGELRSGGACAGAECVFAVFASHGYAHSRSSDTEIRCADGRLLSLYSIIDYFSNANFPALRGVPKVFIFQTCRGEQQFSQQRPAPLPAPAPRPRPRLPAAAAAAGALLDGTVYSDDEPPEEPPGPEDRDRPYSDILIAHSTVPGYVSHRDSSAGSWYIQVLCRVFAARAHDCHVDQLLSLVDEEMWKEFHTQTSSVDRWGFNRRLYLHPGLHEA